MSIWDVIVMGGGAAGVFAALAAAEAQPGMSTLVLEKGENLLAKVRISGGGRCNLTHACYDPARLVTYYPRGSKELRGPFTHFQPRDTVAWFERRGVKLRTYPDGCIFPASNDSQTIIDCLLGEARRLGVELRTRCGIRHIDVNAEHRFHLVDANGESYMARQVLLAAGGGIRSAYAMTAGLGHTIVPPVPSLFTFTIPDPRLHDLAGIVVPETELALILEDSQPVRTRRDITASGPLLITHWGVSGPAVLRLSAWGARALAECGYRAKLRVNWLPPHTPESLLLVLQTTKDTHLRQHAATIDPSERLSARLWKYLVEAAGIQADQAWNELSNRRLRSLAEQLTRGVLDIQGRGIYKDEFVTCGGVSLKEVDFKSMQSRLHPGLYFAGEVLNIDGLTGGFNLQAAWTTGWIAGKAIAARASGDT